MNTQTLQKSIKPNKEFKHIIKENMKEVQIKFKTSNDIETLNIML